MKIVLLRHGKKQSSSLPDVPDDQIPLDPGEHARAEQVRDALETNGLAPRIILTSHNRHAVETAELLRCDITRAVIPVTGLTPHTDKLMFSLPAILYEGKVLWGHPGEWRAEDSLLLVGHERRLSNLAEALTGVRRQSELEFLSALVLDFSVQSVRSVKP
jgi:phosphohistidine phosphatase SixA